jgi:Sulfotransferase family
MKFLNLCLKILGRHTSFSKRAERLALAIAAMPSLAKNQPNFFIVGAPKAGTTSLYHYLGQHPQIFMSPLKEPNFFALEVRPESFGPEFRARARRNLSELQTCLRGPVLEQRFGGIISEWEDYLKLFKNVNGEKAIGEASVCYLWSKSAARNIASRIPNAKVLMILRNPVERAFAQYLHSVTNGLVRDSFRKRIEIALRCEHQDFGILNPFLELGLYYEQVRRYLEIFPAAQMRVYFFEDYKKRPVQLLADIFRFLDVSPAFAANMSQKHLEPLIPRSIEMAYFLKRYGIWQRVKDMSPPALRSRLRVVAFRNRESLVMDAESRKRLAAYYEDDVRQLSNLLGRDLAAWLS